ncbi:MAG: RecX family transcriptional regulator [Prolixibacteraceae bacterium]|nr:RecX family transcriptional regulator [Prolixibacteraceae bacterium]
MENRELIVKEAYSKMAQLCSRSEQCTADIRRKMVVYELVDEIVEEVISKLKKEKFIDDKRFVMAYVSDKFRLNKWGKIKMKHYLKMKGLPDNLIKEGLDLIDDEKYIAVLIKTMKEKAKTIKKKDKFEKMGQIIRFTQNRGFEPELIHRYLNKVVE